MEQVRYNCLGYPYSKCSVCGAPEVRLTKSGSLHRSHLKGPRHQRAVREAQGIKDGSTDKPWREPSVILDRLPTAEELKKAESEERYILNVYTDATLRSIGLRQDSSLEKAQAVVKRAGLWPSKYHSIGIASAGQQSKHFAERWLDNLDWLMDNLLGDPLPFRRV